MLLRYIFNSDRFHCDYSLESGMLLALCLDKLSHFIKLDSGDRLGNGRVFVPTDFSCMLIGLSFWIVQFPGMVVNRYRVFLFGQAVLDLVPWSVVFEPHWWYARRRCFARVCRDEALLLLFLPVSSEWWLAASPREHRVDPNCWCTAIKVRLPFVWWKL